jgi:hypothetical protein
VAGRRVVLARASVIVMLGGFEAIHVGTDPYVPIGIGVVLAGVGVGRYAFIRVRRLKRRGGGRWGHFGTLAHAALCVARPRSMDIAAVISEG